MRERLLTLALAGAAFVLFYLVLLPKPAPPQERPTRPVSDEAGPNGYQALSQWLSAEGFAAASFRERYDKLIEASETAAGNLLVTSLPHVYPVRNSELRALQSWVLRGNTVLVLASLSDTPDWAMTERAGTLLADLARLTDLQFEQIPSATEQQQTQTPAQAALAARQRLEHAARFEWTPNGPHPLLAGVESGAALSEYPTAKWRPHDLPDRLVLELARERGSEAPVLWWVSFGGGQIIVSAYGSMLTNKSLREPGNARLFANIVGWSLEERGRVLFDDAHQGLVAFYDADAFYGDKRLHASIWWLIVLWLIFVLGSTPLRARAAQWAPLNVTTFVRASGGFMARVVRRPLAARRLFENFFNEVRAQLGMPMDGGPVWTWLKAHAALPSHQLAELEALHARALQGRSVDLAKVHELLLHARTKLK